MSKAKMAVLAVVAIAAALGLMAQLGPGQGRGPGAGAGPGGQGARMYNPQTVQTVSGEVASVEKTEGKRPGVYGVRISVKSGGETLAVSLGPSSFLEAAGLRISAGDKVTVTGSRITLKGQPLMLAAGITKGDKAVKLRDASGVPLWSRGAK